jgi:hypothetical protein
MDEFVLGEFVGRIALSARYGKNARLDEAIHYVWRGIVWPIHGPNPSAQARRASLRLSKFVPDEFVEPWVLIKTSLSARYAKSASVDEGIRCGAGDCSARPWAEPLRASAEGPACGCPNSFQTNLSNRGFSSRPLSPPDTQKAPNGRFLRIWRRERDSNPR